MEFADAAAFFRDTQAYDGYTGVEAFLCHFSSFDDSSSDGSTSRRRVLNLADEDEIPVRRVVSIFGDRWIIGGGNPDSYGGEVIRRSYGMKKATDLALLRTPGQACLGAGGTTAYVQKQYFKDTVNQLTTGEIDTFWNVFIAPDEPVQRGTFLICGSLILRSRQTYLPVEGLNVAQSDQLDPGTAETVTFTGNGSYDPVTDEIATLSTAVPSLLFDFNKLYRFRTEADRPAKPGDLTMLVAAASITPTVGARFTRVDGSGWQVLSVEAELDAWLMHVRRG